MYSKTEEQNKSINPSYPSSTFGSCKTKRHVGWQARFLEKRTLRRGPPQIGLCVQLEAVGIVRLLGPS